MDPPGATADSEPEWPTTWGATVVDEDVTWTVESATGSVVAPWTPATTVSKNQLIVPTTGNGHYYVCSQSGVTDATEPVAWTTDLGDPTSDGTAEWLPVNGAWRDGEPVFEGQLVIPSAPNGHVYRCTTPGTTDDEPAWQPDWDWSGSEGGDPSDPHWEQAGSIVEVGRDRILPWQPGTVVAVDDIILPRFPNGHFYRCTTAGTTDTSEPVWPLADDGTVEDGPDVVWQEAGTTLVGVQLRLGNLFRIERAQILGWATGVFLDGAANVDATHVYFGGLGETVGLQDSGPGTVGIQIGGGDEAVATAANDVEIRQCLFNEHETGVWDALDANHHMHDNTFQQPTYGQAGRIGSIVGTPVCSAWDNNVTSDPLRTHAGLWITQTVNALEVRSNFFITGTSPAIVVRGTVNGFTLLGNHFNSGDETTPVVTGMVNLLGALLASANDYNTAAEHYDQDPTTSALHCEADPTLSMVGVNNVTPQASLDIRHGCGVALPAIRVRDETYEYFTHSIKNVAAPQKQERRFKTVNAENGRNGGSATVLESTTLDNGASGTVCAFELPSYCTALVSWSVVGRHTAEAGGRTCWHRMQMVIVEADVVTYEPGAPDDVVGPYVTGDAFPGGGGTQAALDDDGATIAINLIAPEESTSYWEAELEVVILHEPTPP